MVDIKAVQLLRKGKIGSHTGLHVILDVYTIPVIRSILGVAGNAEHSREQQGA
jgi:hypothetical protein